MKFYRSAKVTSSEKFAFFKPKNRKEKFQIRKQIFSQLNLHEPSRPPTYNTVERNSASLSLVYMCDWSQNSTFLWDEQGDVCIGEYQYSSRHGL